MFTGMSPFIEWEREEVFLESAWATLARHHWFFDDDSTVFSNTTVEYDWEN